MSNSSISERNRPQSAFMPDKPKSHLTPPARGKIGPIQQKYAALLAAALALGAVDSKVEIGRDPSPLKIEQKVPEKSDLQPCKTDKKPKHVYVSFSLADYTQGRIRFSYSENTVCNNASTFLTDVECPGIEVGINELKFEECEYGIALPGSKEKTFLKGTFTIPKAYYGYFSGNFDFSEQCKKNTSLSGDTSLGVWPNGDAFVIATAEFSECGLDRPEHARIGYICEVPVWNDPVLLEKELLILSAGKGAFVSTDNFGICDGEWLPYGYFLNFSSTN